MARALAFGKASLSLGHALGPLTIAAERDVGSRFTVGGAYSYLRIRQDGTGAGAPTVTTEYGFHTLLAQASVRYARHGSFHLSSGLSIGAVQYRLSGGQPHLAFAGHLHVLGFRWGRRVGAWADLGIGSLGIVNGGLLVRF